MNLELIGTLVVLTLLCVGYIAVKSNPKKSKDDGFVWQPDLSHKVVILESPPINSKSKEQRIVLVEKTPEERAEEKRAYLKERNYD